MEILIRDKEIAIALGNKWLNADLLERHGWRDVAIEYRNIESRELVFRRNLQDYEAEIWKANEIACGWLCYWQSSEWIRTNGAEGTVYSIGADNSPMIVNQWSGEVVMVSLLSFPTLEACIRDYENRLPAEQQTALLAYKHLSLYSPVRFTPAQLRLGKIETFAEVPELHFEIAIEKQFLTQFGIEYPEVGVHIDAFKSITMEQVRENPDGTVSFLYRAIYDREKVKSDMGVLGNQINLILPAPQQADDGVKTELNVSYWMEIRGSLQEFDPWP